MYLITLRRGCRTTQALLWPQVCGVYVLIRPAFAYTSSISLPGPQVGPTMLPHGSCLPIYLNRPAGDSLLNCNPECVSAL